MKKINCIAIDDEPIALSVISQFCLRTGGLDLLTYSEPQEGLQAVIDRQPDIVFLDIEMDCLNGLDIARKLPASTCFIFTTAYIRYASTDSTSMPPISCTNRSPTKGSRQPWKKSAAAGIYP